MKKENDRENGMRYNEDMDSFDESRSRMGGGSVLWNIRINKMI